MAEYQVGAYYFPNYHPDDRNALVHGPGWTEWELVKRAEPRFPGHAQPRVPLWALLKEPLGESFESVPGAAQVRSPPAGLVSRAARPAHRQTRPLSSRC